MTIDSHIACDICLRRCRLGRGELGFCGVWKRAGDAIVLAQAFAVTECAVETVEKKGLYHYRPGSLVYALGGWGCNLHCSHCRNHQVACVRSAASGEALAPPDQLVASARAAGCAGLAWGFSEPTLWLNSLTASSTWARAQGLFSLVCTNGIASREVYRRLMDSGVGVWKVDLKGFSADGYRHVAGFSEWRGVLDNLVMLRSGGGHVELSWCPIPGDDSNLTQARAFGEWIVGHLGFETPVHLNAFFPAYRRLNLPFAEPAWLRHLRDALLDAGVRHVYLPQSLRTDERATWCGHCRALLVERPALGKPKLYLDGVNRCAVCGHSASLILQ